jgi:predicted dehydrogenase
LATFCALKKGRAVSLRSLTQFPRGLEVADDNVSKRALVVGYGSIARRHLDNLRALGAAREYIVFRPGGRPPAAPAELRFVATLVEALETAPDFAVVASPSAAHMESLLPLLQAGVPCYVEKPAVTTSADVERLHALLTSDRSPPITLMGCNLRFLPSLRRMRELLRGGAIGQPVRATFQAGQWLPDWRAGRDYRESYSARASAGGGVILDLIHEIDAARWLFGEFDELHALRGKFSRLELDAEDTACLLLGRSSGPLVSIGLDYVSRQRVRRYEIVGDEGTLTLDVPAARLTVTTPRGSELVTDTPASFDVTSTYRAAMEEFVAAVRGADVTSQDLLDGLASTALALRAKSA